MEFFKKIADFIQELEEKDFYKYIIIFLVSLLMIISFMVYRYYSQISEYKQEIERINDIRNDKVKQLLKDIKIFDVQQKEADAELKKVPDFQIKPYFGDILKRLNLTEYAKAEGNLNEVPEEKYTKIEYSVELSGMNMMQLCQILDELEKTRRITINLLDIKKSQKSDAIDVTLTISTLLPKNESMTS